MILFPEIEQIKKKKKLSKPFSLEMRLASRLVIKLHLTVIGILGANIIIIASQTETS